MDWPDDGSRSAHTIKIGWLIRGKNRPQSVSCRSSACRASVEMGFDPVYSMK